MAHATRAVIVQARMTSTRLPGKVLMDLAGRPLLSQELRRLKLCGQIDQIVVATTDNATDNPICALADSEGIRWFRGSESDVLSRYLGAAREARVDIIIRITADCPLIDPEVTDRIVLEMENHLGACDYASNVIRRTFPRGLDTEVLTRDALERIDRLATSAAAREHVTHFLLQERPDLFRVRSVTDLEDNSDLRWTVDTTEDLALARRLYEELNLGRRPLGYREILRHVRGRPELAALNSHIVQKSV